MLVSYTWFPIEQTMGKANHSIVSQILYDDDGVCLLFLGQSIRLETEQEEKRLLQDQLRQLEISSNEASNKLSQQIDQVNFLAD